MEDAKVNDLISAARPVAGDGADIWADIGGLYDQKAFQCRVDALTSPTAYADKRNLAPVKIKDASVTAYKTAYNGYIEAGLSPEMAKLNATNSAKSEYHN